LSRVNTFVKWGLPLIAMIAIAFTFALVLRPDTNESNTSSFIESAAPLPTSEEVDPNLLRILIWEGHAPQAHVDRFKKHIQEKYDVQIELNIRYMDGTDCYYDLIRSDSVDLVMLTHDLLKDERFNLIKNKLILPLDLKNIPNFQHLIPTLKNAGYLLCEGNVYACPESQGPYGLARNTSIIKEEVTSWNALWDPRFKGKYVIGANEYIYNAHITALALGYPIESIGSFDALNNPEFKAKLRQLATNAHSFWIGVDKAENLYGHQLAAVWGDSLGPLKERSEIWQMEEPAEGTPFWIDNCALTSALADHPFLKKIAEEYINMLLSTEYQAAHILRVIQTIPVVSNIEHLLTPAEKKRIQAGTPHFFDKKKILLPTYSRRDRNGLKLLWDEAMEGVPVEKPEK
jgi:spermidine/putrescine-binding protein